jgi:hypothetical protein
LRITELRICQMPERSRGGFVERAALDGDRSLNGEMCSRSAPGARHDAGEARAELLERQTCSRS